MNDIGLGDMARGFRTRQGIAATKTQLERLSQQLSTGRKDDVSTQQSGDFGPVAGVEHRLRQLDAEATVNAEAKAFWDGAQTALERVQAAADAAIPNLLLGQQVVNAPLLTGLGEEMGGRLASVVSALNTRFGDQAVFAGAATQSAALVDPETLMASIGADVAGATTLANVETALDAYFAVGGGFDAAGYLGSDTPLAPSDVGAGISVSFDVQADDPAFREMLKGFAMGALVGSGTFGFTPSEDAAMAKRAGEILIDAQAQVTRLRSDIGTGQQRIDEATAAISAERVSFELTRENLVGIDPYQTAIELNATEARLESIYMVTARLANLRLMNWLR